MYNLERNNNCGLNLFEEFDNFFANVLEKDMKTNTYNINFDSGTGKKPD